MDDWRFLNDLHDALFGWLGWPTFKERRHHAIEIEIHEATLKGMAEAYQESQKELADIRDELNMCKSNLDKLHHHYKSMFS